MYQPIENEIFHVHTWRCKHASEEKDYEYVEKAIDLGASRIVFTDHSPFLDNPFRSRMDIEQLTEYISSLNQLQKEFREKIEIKIGLEVEYLPSFHEFYAELVKIEGLDLLMLGQHMFEHEDGSWSFADKEQSGEYIGLCNAIVEGIKTGYFDVVAHPDRSFRRCKDWTEDMMQASAEIVMAAKNYNVLLERNYSSMKHKKHYWKQFWSKETVANSIYGYDAHSVAEMETIWKKRMV